MAASPFKRGRGKNQIHRGVATAAKPRRRPCWRAQKRWPGERVGEVLSRGAKSPGTSSQLSSRSELRSVVPILSARARARIPRHSPSPATLQGPAHLRCDLGRRHWRLLRPALRQKAESRCHPADRSSIPAKIASISSMLPLQQYTTPETAHANLLCRKAIVHWQPHGLAAAIRSRVHSATKSRCPNSRRQQDGNERGSCRPPVSG
jgi:hypothetical protein